MSEIKSPLQIERDEHDSFLNAKKVTLVADKQAMKMTVVGSVTYLAIALPGTPMADAKWQCKKIDETSGIVITWADGDMKFDNVATDLTALSYS